MLFPLWPDYTGLHQIICVLPLQLIHSAFASQVILAPVDDAQATAKLATLCDVITFENEFINLEALQKLEHQGVCFHPSLTALAPLLDKYHQRNFLRNLGLPVPRFQAVESTTKNSPWGFPVVVKARRHGYDGKGTFIVHNQEELTATQKDRETSNLMLEEFVPFERELAVMAARGRNGEVVVYPIVETQQEEQVCRRVIAPAGIDAAALVHLMASKSPQKMSQMCWNSPVCQKKMTHVISRKQKRKHPPLHLAHIVECGKQTVWSKTLIQWTPS